MLEDTLTKYLDIDNRTRVAVDRSDNQIEIRLELYWDAVTDPGWYPTAKRLKFPADYGEQLANIVRKAGAM